MPLLNPIISVFGCLHEFILFLLCRLRDEVRNIPCTYKSRNDAAADLIHIYAFTKNFFRIQVPNYIISTAFSFNYACLSTILRQRLLFLTGIQSCNFPTSLH